jgi:hypothetical protein
MPTTLQVALSLALALIVALALGTIYGESFVGTLLAFS